MEKILWSSQKPPMRYFWVPSGEDVFVGDYVIENNEGESFSVDLESLIPFEVTSTQAEALMMQDLENMTKELGGLFKGLFQLGKRMLDNEVLEDSEEDSEWDSTDSEDSDDLDKILELFDEESSSDWDADNDSDELGIEDLFSQFSEEIEGPLSELRDIITKEVGNLGEELDKLGKNAAESLDDNPEAGQSILRELGEWLIRLADQDSISDEEDEAPIIVPFPSIPEPSSFKKSSEDNASSESEQQQKVGAPVSDPISAESEAYEEIATDVLDEASVEATEKAPIDWPSPSALKRMNKSALIDFGESLGITLTMTQSKIDLLAAIETLR